MKSWTIRTVSTIAVTGALLLGGAGVAGAAESTGRAKADTHTASATDAAKSHRNHRAADSTLTAAQDRGKAGSKGSRSGKHSGRTSAAA